MRLAAATWPEVETYLKTHKTLLLPVGSTEQHGPSGLMATDTICADAVALETGRRLGYYVAPPLYYGMSSHHMAFPGSATVRPSVYQAFLAELLRGFYSQGFRRFYFVNGHGGNEASLTCVFQELKHEGAPGASFQVYNWWKLPEVAALARELYGDEEGSHATPMEVSLAFHVEGIERRDYQKIPEPPASAWPLNAQEMRTVFKSGTIRSNPGLAHRDHGRRVLDLAATSLVRAIEKASFLA